MYTSVFYTVQNSSTSVLSTIEGPRFSFISFVAVRSIKHTVWALLIVPRTIVLNSRTYLFLKDKKIMQNCMTVMFIFFWPSSPYFLYNQPLSRIQKLQLTRENHTMLKQKIGSVRE